MPLALPLLAALAACGGDAPGADGDWGGTVTDSAGVRVVANPEAGLWGDTSPWSLEEEFRVGALDPETGADPGAEFGAVVGVDVDEEGNLYVADQQARTIHVFAPDGEPKGTIGTPGEGPGEIGMALAGVFAVDGEVWAADVANMRISRYDPDGELLGSVPLDFSRGVPIVWDRVGDRLVVQFRNINPQTAVAGQGDPVVTVGAETVDTVAVLEAGQSVQAVGGVPRIRMFAAEPVWDAATDGRVVSALNSRYRYEVRDASGELRLVVTRPFTVREITESDQNRLLRMMREMMAAQGAPPQAVEQMMGQIQFAETYPAFARLLAGPDGTVWVQGIQTTSEVAGSDETFNPQDLGSARWDVFDDEGRYLGVMTLPERFTPLRVEDDGFWGVQRDELGVNSVAFFRLVRG